MPSDKFKFSAKGGVAPVIKKLYNSHKKLLGRGDKNSAGKSGLKAKKSEEKLTIEEVKYIPESKDDKHTYENVEFAKNFVESKTFSDDVFDTLNKSLENLNFDVPSSSNDVTYIEVNSYTCSSADSKSIANCDELSLSICSNSSQGKSFIYLNPDTTISDDRLSQPDNVTVIEIGERRDSKLKIVIDNFDKILNEYNTVPPKPKLQKSKTCSIIESKCILKKARSGPATAEKDHKPLSRASAMTKSLFHLDREGEITFFDSKKMPNADVLKLVSEFNRNLIDQKVFERNRESFDQEKSLKQTKADFVQSKSRLDRTWDVYDQSFKNFDHNQVICSPSIDQKKEFSKESKEYLNQDSETFKTKENCNSNNIFDENDCQNFLEISNESFENQVESKRRFCLRDEGKPELALNNNEKSNHDQKSENSESNINNSSEKIAAKIGQSKENLKQNPSQIAPEKPVVVKELIKRINSLNSDDQIKIPSKKSMAKKPSVDPKKLPRKKSDLSKEKKAHLRKDLDVQKGATSNETLNKSKIEHKPPTYLKKPRPNHLMKTETKQVVNQNGDGRINQNKVIQKSLIPRAISCYDVSNLSRKSQVSRIPIKSNLNRTYPSTPNNLNGVDCVLGRADVDFEGSCESIKYSSQNGNRNGITKAYSVQNLTKVPSRENLIKSRSRLSRDFDDKRFLMNKLSLKKENERSVSNQNVGLRNQRGKEVLNDVQASGNGAKKAGGKNGIVNENEREIVRIFLENFENDLENNKKTASVKNPIVFKKSNTHTRKPILDIDDNKVNKSKVSAPKKAETFGAKKSTLEPKFAERIGDKKKPLTRTETYNKNDRIQQFRNIENLEKNIKTAKQLFISTNLISCTHLKHAVPTIGDHKISVDDPEISILTPDVRRDGTTCKNPDGFDAFGDSLDSQISKGDPKKDYASDDNSDDSGNISNELELEFDENAVASAAIFSSSESLPDPGKDSDSAALKSDGSDFSLNEDEKIFFRTGVLTQLESQRDEKLAGMVVNLQAHCRGFLARRRLSQRKLQDLAVRCVQRNVRKFLLVRDWPWWRLLVRVTPLLNVHRTEEELRLKTEELETLKTKLEKIESDRTSLKHQNDKLEARLSEMTADLAEEHSTSTLAAERLDAETADRIRLERELNDMQQKNKDLQSTSEKLEMELLYARSDLNHMTDDDEDPENEPVYKQRYERVVRELEFTKRRLQQQHEDDLEQLVGLKKQLEKKLTDAYEEVEEQRQVVGQWKRKVQKLTAEMGDIKLLLEEQTARNNLLEKKQRKFDSELQTVQEELKKERQNKERLSREKEVLTTEKFTLESIVADLRLELDLKEEKLENVQKELDELTYGGKTEEEVTVLRKQKIDCERRLFDQNEELDELAGQVQLLEQAKLKLEMSLEQQRKVSKKEAQQHEEELEEVRCNAQKKVKALEAQLENEHEERTVLLKEKHELERRMSQVLENDRSEKAGDEALVFRLKRDLKRTKALLRDTQSQLERQKTENPSKTTIRQLRNQLDDVECARSAAVKSKQLLEGDLSETQAQLEETTKQKNDLEDKLNSTNREKTDLQNQVEENEEELAEVLKKYKTTIQQMSLDQMALQEQVALVGELELEKNALKEQLAEMSSRLETVENMGDASSNILVRRGELKVKELENKLELEQTTRQRLEVQISRLKEAVEKIQNDLTTHRNKEQQAQDQIRKLQRSLRELRDEHNNALTKEGESILKRKELEKKYEALEAETSTVRADLRLALKRIEDLQTVIQNDLEDSSENSDSEQDSYSSDDSVNSFLKNHRLSSKPSTMQIDNQKRSPSANNLTKDSSYA